MKTLYVDLFINESELCLDMPSYGVYGALTDSDFEEDFYSNSVYRSKNCQLPRVLKSYTSISDALKAITTEKNGPIFNFTKFSRSKL